MTKKNIHIDQFFILADSISRKNILRKYSSILLIIGFVSFLSPKSSFAQSDTTGTAAKTDSIIEYLTPLEYAFMMHEETKFMLRIPAVGLGAEVETLPYLTLLGQFYYRTGNTFYNSSYPILDAQIRYYYGSKKKGIRNMSGNYFALGYENPMIFSDGYQTGFYYAKWGVQRRFMGYGLIDIGMNAGVYSEKISWPYYENARIQQGFFIQSTAQVGLGIVFGNEKMLDRERLCPVIKCYERENFIFKINTTNLFSVFHSTTAHQNEIRISPKIALEQKLFNWPVSIGADVGLDYQWFNNNNNDPYDWKSFSEGDLALRLQGRYYYNLKSRIRKGKSGNGLSANYLSGGVYQSVWLSPDLPNHYGYGYTISTGVQRTFSDHFYFDVEIGLQHGDHDYIYLNGFEVFADIQVGLKF